MAAKNNSNELRLTRVYDAPVKAVWDAWTDEKKVAKWWGPRGFTLTTHAKDFKPGGIWHYTMHGPDGTDYPNKTVYLEIDKHRRLVYDHGGYDDRPPLFRVTVLFTEVKGKTKMEMTMALPSAEAAAETRKFIKSAGGEATWDRLAEYLGEELDDKKKFVINRTFHASIETMFAMWTRPEHFEKWLPPTGFTMTFLRRDIRPGGSAFYMMTNGEFKMHGRCEYREIRSPDRIVYTQEFCDENEKMSRHPHAPTWPATMLTTVTLFAEDEKHTRVSVQWEPVGEVSREEMETFLKERGGMTQGWTGSFDKLENLLGGGDEE